MPVGFGKKIREGVANAERKAKKRYMCPSCSRVAIKRISPAIWRCRKCNAEYASGTFEFKE